ncbi:MAG: PDZ domain-containing protein [Planctomycetaceae bacterium]
MRILAALLLPLLAAPARAEGLGERLWMVRVSREEQRGAGAVEVFLAPALPAGPDGLLLCAGFSLDAPRENASLEAVAIAPDGAEHEAQFIGGHHEEPCTFFRVKGEAAKSWAPVELKGVAAAEGARVLILGRHGVNLGYALRRKRTRVEAAVLHQVPVYAMEGLDETWLGCVALTADGRLIGFVTTMDSLEEEGGYVVGVGEATTIVVAAEGFAEMALHPGPPELKAWLGINLSPLDEERERFFGVEEDLAGALVTGVAEGSPAARAGVRLWDVLQRIGDLEVYLEKAADREAFLARVQRLPLGKPLPCRVLRFTEGPSGSYTRAVLELEMTLEARPVDFADAPEGEVPELGLKCRSATQDWLAARALPAETRGVVVTRVREGSPAELAGVLPDDLVLQADGAPIADLVSLKAATAAARLAGRAKVVLFVRRGAETAFLSLRPSW